MTDLVIADVDERVLRRVEAAAARDGLDAAEYVRAQLPRLSATTVAPLTSRDLDRFSELAADLGDPDVMSRAWA
jgi:hypothetical protein